MLTAIAIPVFTSQLEKSREATDLANLRSAYAQQMTAILTWDGSSTIDPLSVTAKQTQTNWQSDGNAAQTTIADGLNGAGVTVATSTTGWNVKANVDTTGATEAYVSVDAK